MRRYVFLVVAFLSLVLSITSFAMQTPTPQQTQSLIKSSGVKVQVGQIAALVQYGIDEAMQDAGLPVPPQVDAALRQAVASSFNATIFLNEVQRSIENGLSRQDVEAVLQWLDSPVGKRITRLEEAGSSPAALAEMESMKVQLLKDADRVKLIKRFDAAIKGSEYSADLMMNVQVAMATSMAAILAPDDPTVHEQIFAAVSANRSQIELEARDKTLQSFLYTYRSLNEEELNRYIDFISSGVGVRYHEVMKQGMNSGFLSASRSVGKTLAQTLR
jgi:hypothetical protein